jgi:peptidyl-prolyl cis-trans isomerase C
MIRRAVTMLAVAATVAACSQKPPTKKGPFVVTGDGIAITAEELKARLDETPAIVRPAFANPELKKLILEDMIKFELMARVAERAGIARDPEVVATMRRVMATKFQQRVQQEAVASIREAEVKQYFDEHQDEFNSPARVHAAHILVAAEVSGPARARKLAEARKLLGKVLADERLNRAAFARIATESSDEADTRSSGGDLMYRSREELEKAFGAKTAEALFALKDDETAQEVIETPQGFHLFHVYGRQAEEHDTLDEARPGITRVLAAERKVTGFEDTVKKLREAAGITVDDAALEQISVGASPVATRDAH